MASDISGLPASLPDVVYAYIEALPAGRFMGFPLGAIDRTGIHAWKVALFLADGAAMPGNMPSGYGFGLDDESAIIGAFGEIAEAILPTLRLIETPRRLGSYHELRAEVGPRGIADPLTLCLPAGSPVGRDTPLAWTAAHRVATGEPVLVPLDLAATDHFELPEGYKPFTPLITNGLGAGPDLEWAIGHGLLELLQRDGNGLVFRALDRGIVLDLSSGVDAVNAGLLAHLDALGIEVLPKFATDAFGQANLYVVGYDRDGHQPSVPIMLSACGEACDPDRNVALRKALLEFMSARVRKAYAHGPLAVARQVAPEAFLRDFVEATMPSLVGGEVRAFETTKAWATMSADELRQELAPIVFSRRSQKAFADLPEAKLADTRERGRAARLALEAAGFDVLAVDGSPKEGGIGVAKVIVPGLEVETMSYHRIGLRNTQKLLERDIGLIRFGQESKTIRPVRLTPEVLESLGGRQPLLDIAAVDRVVGSLYPLYREPEAHHVAHVLETRSGAPRSG
jgi:ribosomal protein S12 methylthiotransferase accessory factor